MNKKNRIAQWGKRTVFALLVHLSITGMIWALVVGLWVISGASYESKALQLGVLAILSLPFILDIPAIITLLKIDSIRKFLT
jgi:hypothetical protein